MRQGSGPWKSDVSSRNRISEHPLRSHAPYSPKCPMHNARDNIRPLSSRRAFAHAQQPSLATNLRANVTHDTAHTSAIASLLGAGQGTRGSHRDDANAEGSAQTSSQKARCDRSWMSTRLRSGPENVMRLRRPLESRVIRFASHDPNKLLARKCR